MIEQEPIIQTKTSKKIIIIGLAAVFVFLGGIFWLGRHYEQVDQASGKSPSLAAIDPQKLAADYQTGYVNIVGPYLAKAGGLANLGTDEFKQETAKVQQDLLLLKVPAALKDYHLSSVLLLSQIETASAEKNQDQAEAKLNSLKEILANF